MAALLALALLAAPPEALIHANARLALREGRPLEAVELWLLRNAHHSETGRLSPHDGDHRSVTWAALGALGLCPDGYPPDDTGDGAGLWPLALHNWLLRNRRDPPPGPEGSPFAAFTLGRQQRHVSLHDVLDADELDALTLRRTDCWWRPRLAARVAAPWSDLADARVAARALRSLLRQSLTTLDPRRVIGRAAIEARIFDLDLRIAGLDASALRAARRDAAADGRRAGLSRAELAALRRDTDAGVAPDAEATAILDKSLDWTPDEWLTLSPDRRQYLFAHAADRGDAARVVPLTLALIDRLAEDRRGAEVQGLIARLGDDPAARRAAWHGDRGARLLALDPDTGFRERAPIALHRGQDALAEGRLPDALTSFAQALQWAESSRDAEDVQNLARRWLSFVAAQFRVTDELLAMLQRLVPRTDYAIILEDQLWHAALNADRDSFERALRHPAGQGALAHRAERLRPLAAGDATAFAEAIEADLTTEPAVAHRFLARFVERVEAADAAARAAHLPLLRRLAEGLEAHRLDPAGRPQRRVTELIERLAAIIDGLAPLPPDATATDRARGLDPQRELHAGSVRLAPTDPLPWPFTAPVVQPPSVFTPLILRPEEWRVDGATVLGWRIHEP
ncbi:MAG: hypothetical protein H6701_12065 [Myxococcales bacterium]|nr:hypothetical protein [Myxococcales bacterium]